MDSSLIAVAVTVVAVVAVILVWMAVYYDRKESKYAPKSGTSPGTVSVKDERFSSLQLIQMRGTDFLDLLLAIKNGEKLPPSIEQRVLANVLVNQELYENLQKVYLGKASLSDFPNIDVGMTSDIVKRNLESAYGIEYAQLVDWEE